jgi:hypothetical protein
MYILGQQSTYARPVRVRTRPLPLPGAGFGDIHKTEMWLVSSSDRRSIARMGCNLPTFAQVQCEFVRGPVKPIEPSPQAKTFGKPRTVRISINPYSRRQDAMVLT